jgi:hypothetical protein
VRQVEPGGGEEVVPTRIALDAQRRDPGRERRGGYVFLATSFAVLGMTDWVPALPPMATC